MNHILSCRIDFSMSPSRLMAIMDPLLNTGFLWRCLAAYAGIKADNESPQDELTSTKDSQITPEKDLKNNVATPSTRQTVPGQQSKPEVQTSGPMREDTYYARLCKMF